MCLTGGYRSCSEAQTQQEPVGVELNLIIIPAKLMAPDRSEYSLDEHQVTATCSLGRGLPIFQELVLGLLCVGMEHSSGEMRWEQEPTKGSAFAAVTVGDFCSCFQVGAPALLQ